MPYNYTIDGNNLKTVYGISVERLDGIDDLPARKGQTSQEFPDEYGEESFTDANDIYFETQELTFKGYMEASDQADYISKVQAFKTLMSAPGLRDFQTDHRPGVSMDGYVVSGIKFGKLTKLIPSKVAQATILFKYRIPETMVS